MPDVMPIPNVEFTVNDRGGEYFAKLQSLAAAVDTAVGAANEIIERDDLLEDYLQLVTDDYKGPWAGLTGELNQPASSDHNGVMWRLEVDLPNVTLSEPSDENEDWSRESARFASGEDLAIVAATAGTAMQPGAGGWLGGAISLGDANASTAPLGSVYYFSGTHTDAVAQGLPDIGLSGGDGVHWIVFTYGTSTRAVQTVTQVISIGGTQGWRYSRVKIDAAWLAWVSGQAAAPVNPFAIIPLLSPTQATQVSLGGNAYRHDIEVDLRLGRWFQGYACVSDTYLPVGESVPTSFNVGSYTSTQKFNFIGLDDLPTDEQYIGYLNWCGWTLQSNSTGAGTVDFSVPAGWVLKWAGNVAAQFLGRTYYYSGETSNLSRFERLQITVNPLNKTLMLAYAEMSRRN